MVNTTGRTPLVAVVGATGTGKSELAVNIARKYNGEIINGDAMQLYEGLPIITNKMPEDERSGIPHHLLGCIGLNEETWAVGNFVSNALAKISEIRARGRLPILVGGTHYYTQSLLFHDALANKPQTEEPVKNADRPAILEEPTEVLLEKLREVDSVMADRWHPNDRRKIQRSLEIWLQTGRKASDIYEEQRTRREAPDQDTTPEGAEEASRLRMRTLVLWVGAQSDVLSKRLDARVDKMVTQGLLNEVNTLSDFYDGRIADGESIDTTRGIWVAIGYKEFLDYQAALRKGDSSPAQLNKLLALAIEKTKAGTRQYAKRQIRWIRIKLNNAIDTAGAKGSFFMLDGSDLPNWEQDVSEIGLKLVDAFLKEETLPDPSSLSPLAAEMLTASKPDTSARADLWSRKHCEVCNTTSVTESDWAVHINSKRHKKAMSSQRKRALNSTAQQPMPPAAQDIFEEQAKED
ncbi:tRNA isopentenyltransferas-like protein [Aureobasidium pullulans]|uniref:tRNA dimethylallyltransferase n=1 Tax=Aureobasidium pullulans TaxID=5580 RepID=A0AB74K4U3_AURPU|nr:tRNA isopentenyltransferas-like protein [Aureobasidium pullulans]THX57423.1 tRNA isopentenyltransferas-like protein [Aureobasidium pullulans]